MTRAQQILNEIRSLDPEEFFLVNPSSLIEIGRTLVGRSMTRTLRDFTRLLQESDLGDYIEYIVFTEAIMTPTIQIAELYFRDHRRAEAAAQACNNAAGELNAEFASSILTRRPLDWMVTYISTCQGTHQDFGVVRTEQVRFNRHTGEIRSNIDPWTLRTRYRIMERNP